MNKKNKTIVKDRYFRFQTWEWQNVSDEVLLAWLKFQTKVAGRSGVYVQGDWEKNTPSSPSLSKDRGNLILGVNSVTVSYLMHYDSLLQNATDIITKCDSYFITKCNRSLLQNAFFYDNFIIKWDSYYKIRLLLQIAAVYSFIIYLNSLVRLAFHNSYERY